MTRSDWFWFVLSLVGAPVVILLSLPFLPEKFGYKFGVDSFFISIILGWVLSLCIYQQQILSHTKKLQRLHPSNFEVLYSEKEKIDKVKSLYSIDGAVIYATHINDSKSPPFGEQDIAHDLYYSGKLKNRFVRIISKSVYSRIDFHIPRKLYLAYDFDITEITMCELSLVCGFYIVR